MLALRRTIMAARSAAAIQTAPRRGLEEFFDMHNSPYKRVDHGRAWTASELRRKSDEDLHKLWYVCLKERNMLKTLSHDAKSNGRKMDGEHRKKEVKLTMNRIKVVLGERERAIEEYQSEEEARRLAENRERKQERKRLNVIAWEAAQAEFGAGVTPNDTLSVGSAQESQRS